MADTKTRSFVLSLIAGLILAGLSLYGFILLRSRPGLPDGINIQELVRIDDFEIQGPKDIEFVLTRKHIGDWLDFEIRREGDIEFVRAQVIAFYSKVPFPLIFLFIGLFCYLIGFTVFLLKWEDSRARVLYRLAVVFAYSLIVSGGTYCLGHGWFSYVPVVLFYLFYPLAPALLFHFSTSFASRRLRGGLFIVYLLSLLFAVFFISAVLIATLKPSITVFRLYISVFQIFRSYMVLLLLLAVFHFVLVYRRAVLEENRAPIKWIFLGLLIGLGPFMFVYQIPTVLKVRPLLGEELASVFFVFIPLAFALSIVRFRFLNVDLVINRGLVYSLLTIFTVSLYLFSARFLEGLFARVFVVRETAISMGSALLAAVAFHPARRKIQELVDRAFFRQSYDYRKATLEFSEVSQKPLSAKVLIDEFVDCVKAVIPVERLAVYVGEHGPQGLHPLHSRGLKAGEDVSSFFAQPSGRLWARRGATGTEEGIDFSRDDLLSRNRLEILLPLPVQSPGLNGFLALGKKRSGQKYRRDDIDLLATLAGELALSLDRIRLQEEVVYERASKEKLNELNRLKTEFIASVSHELRTPLSSIQGLIELLHEGKIREKAKKEETLDTLASESGRLSRLIHNILDFGKIEQGTKTYHLERTEVSPLIEEAARVFRRCLDEGGFALHLRLPSAPVWLMADRDAVEQVLLNLLDNAIKYSPQRKEIEVEVLTGPGEVEIRVGDRGIGIPAEQRELIFERFHRGSEAARINPKGVGLGLKIVRHIMAAHRGEILIEGRTGGGSMFRLIFPKG
jgi:signal transduction histidine kinase